MRIAFKALPTLDDHPYSWVRWTRDSYLPMVTKAMAKAVNARTLTTAQRDMYLAQLNQTLLTAEAEYGKGRTNAPQAAPALPVTTSPMVRQPIQYTGSGRNRRVVAPPAVLNQAPDGIPQIEWNKWSGPERAFYWANRDRYTEE